LAKNNEGKCITVKQSEKLDALQKMAKEYAGEPNKMYLIVLLAEHAEEEEVTAELLRWVEVTLRVVS